jgi:chaperonin cofactor prefoldin
MTTSSTPSPPTQSLAEYNRQYTNLTERLQQLVDNRNTLVTQLNENEGVKEELELLKPGAELFRALGPALVQMDVMEAKELVNGRIKKIQENLSVLETDFEKVGKERQDVISKIQTLRQQQSTATTSTTPPTTASTTTTNTTTTASSRLQNQ